MGIKGFEWFHRGLLSAGVSTTQSDEHSLKDGLLNFTFYPGTQKWNLLCPKDPWL